MNRLLTAARHYADTHASGFGDIDAARRELLAAAWAEPRALHGHVELGAIETSEADARAPRVTLLPIGDDFPEVHVHDVAAGLVARSKEVREMLADARQHDIDHGIGVESAMPPFRSQP